MQLGRLASVWALLLISGAAAMPASGDLEVTGTIATAAMTRATIPLDAILAADTLDLSALDLQAETLTVRRLARGYADFDSPLGRFQVATGDEDVSYMLTGVRAEVAPGDRSGWLGIVGDATSPLFASTPPPLLAKAAGAPFLATGAPRTVDDAPYFRVERAGLHVTLEATGTILYEGPLKLKIGGPDLKLMARENVTTLVTGSDHHDGPAGRSSMRWAVLETSHAVLRIDSQIAWQVIAPSAELTWNGTAEIGGANGRVTIGDAALVATGETARFDGDLALRIAPSSGPVPRLVGTLSGDLRASSLAASSGARVPMREVLPPWAAAAASLILLVAIVVVLLLRRRRQPRLEADDCLEMTHLALALDRLDEARLWIARARKLSPRSGRLMLEEGHVLERMGRHDAALRAYAEAERAMPARGDADLAIARMLQASGAARAEAEARLSRSLEKSPLLLLEVEGDDRLRDLLQAPQVRSAIRAAREALE